MVPVQPCCIDPCPAAKALRSASVALIGLTFLPNPSYFTLDWIPLFRSREICQWLKR